MHGRARCGHLAPYPRIRMPNSRTCPLVRFHQCSPCYPEGYEAAENPLVNEYRRGNDERYVVEVLFDGRQIKIKLLTLQHRRNQAK